MWRNILEEIIAWKFDIWIKKNSILTTDSPFSLVIISAKNVSIVIVAVLT